MLTLAAALLLAATDAGVDVLEAAPPEAAPVVEPLAVEPEPADAGRVLVPAPLSEGDAGVAAAGEGLAPSQFVKGELSVYLGSDRLVVKHNRIGVSAGLDGNIYQPLLGAAPVSVYYLLVEPQVDLRFLDAKLGVGLGVPLRLELVNFDSDAQGPILFRRTGRVRVEDYDSFHDYGRLLKYVSYGRKEDNLYVNIGQRYASTIGHGALMRRYAPNIDSDYPRVSAEVDAYNHVGGFELFTNDILEWNQLAGIAFIKPLFFLGSENLLVKSLSIGVSGALDWKAPLSLNTDAFGVRQLDSEGRLRATEKAVALVGVDVEVKVYKDENVDVKPYLDYSLLIDGQAGITAGALGRFNVGKKTVNAFRVVAELRFLGSRYQPSYFDTFYEVERFIFSDAGANASGFIQYRTKQDHVRNVGLGERVGYYFEGSWGIRGAIGVTLSLEGVSNSAEKNFVAHVEVPVLNFLQLFGSFYKRRFTDFGDFGKFDEKTVLFAGARLKILPFFFLNGRAYKTFRVSAATQRYENQFGFIIDAEIGYEFGGKKADPPSNTPATEAPPAPTGS